MLMNYHELTMNERRDSPARRKQFLVICTIMAGMFAHGMFSAGAFNSIDITEGGFPGGFFVYKYAKRDYASSASLIERIGDDLNVAKSGYGDLLYSLFLDDGAYMSGRTMRYACGILVDKTGQDKKQTLLDMNTEIAKLQKENDNEDPPALELWKLTSYEETSLPSVDSAVLQFPTSNGIVSALVLQYRIIPALRKYAVEKGEAGNVPVVISTCFPEEGMCTHYAPLVKGDEFLLGQPDSETYIKSLPEQDFIDLKGTWKSFKKYFPPFRWLGID